MQLILFIWFIFYKSTCFGRSPRPSSGVIFLQTVVAATGVCYRYGVDKSHLGVIGSVGIIPGSVYVDGLVMLLGSNGESSFYILRGGIPFWHMDSAKTGFHHVIYRTTTHHYSQETSPTHQHLLNRGLYTHCQ